MKKIIFFFMFGLLCSIIVSGNRTVSWFGESWPADRRLSPYNYYFGHDVPKDYAKAYEAAKELAKNGDVISWHVLGNLYENGQAVDKNLDEAIKWHRLAAEEGLVLSQYRLGTMYLGGDGVERNDGEALKWLRLAAGEGYIHAQYALGMALRIGDLAERDEGQARKWLRLAAVQGHLQAIFAYRDKSFTDEWYIRSANSAISAGDIKMLMAIEKGRNYKSTKTLLNLICILFLFL
jgi:TPR repeat protein